MSKISIFSFLIFFSFSAFSDGQIKIIHTGAGLATVTRFPNGSIMVYDTGDFNKQKIVFPEFQEFIGKNDIDLMIISHSDADHLGGTDELFNEYRVHKVIRTGFEREDKKHWNNQKNVILDANSNGLTHDINFKHTPLSHGTIYKFGDAQVQIISGYYKPPEEWGLKGSEFRNGNSIVIRLSYAGSSVLFTGDSVGRKEHTDDKKPAIATERYMIDNAQHIPIHSDILIAPHHGGDDGSSLEFINAVSPRWVVFPAGSKHGHPRNTTVGRYKSYGLKDKCLLRTDLGDNEKKEWPYGATQNKDKVGDDNILITLRENKEPLVRYENSAPVICQEVIDNDKTLIKKSSSGICHSSKSPWYNRIKYFTKFEF